MKHHQAQPSLCPDTSLDVALDTDTNRKAEGKPGSCWLCCPPSQGHREAAHQALSMDSKAFPPHPGSTVTWNYFQSLPQLFQKGIRQCLQGSLRTKPCICTKQYLYYFPRQQKSCSNFIVHSPTLTPLPSL